MSKKKWREEPRECEKCGGLFYPKVFWQKFCSVDCKSRHHNERIKRGLMLLEEKEEK